MVNLEMGLNISTLLMIWKAPCLLFSTGFCPAPQLAHVCMLLEAWHGTALAVSMSSALNLLHTLHEPSGRGGLLRLGPERDRV